jgi:hypothetical protein
VRAGRLARRQDALGQSCSASAGVIVARPESAIAKVCCNIRIVFSHVLCANYATASDSSVTKRHPAAIAKPHVRTPPDQIDAEKSCARRSDTE